MTRVLVLTNMYPPHHLGGYELSCHDVVEGLRARGHEVDVLTSSMRVDGVEDHTAERPYRVWRDLQLYLKDDRTVSLPLRACLRIERDNQSALRRALERTQPEVVSVWHMGALSQGLVTTIVRAGVPIVYSICDDWLSYGPRLDPWTRALDPLRAVGRVVGKALGAPPGCGDLSRTGAFLFVSRMTRDRSVRYTRRIYRRSDVVLSGIDATLFRRRPGPSQRAWGWRLLYVGRYDARKGIDAAIEALPLLPAEATLRIIGAGGTEERSRLEDKVRHLGLIDRVRFEQRPREELPGCYSGADVLLFPSEWEEPFGLVPIEAMACGTLVVATGVGGSIEFLRDHANCVLFTPGDPRSLAKAIEDLGSDEELRRRLIAEGLRTAEQFDIERLTDAFERWHTAAASGYTFGEPPPRRVNLPPAPGTWRVGARRDRGPTVPAAGTYDDRCLAGEPSLRLLGERVIVDVDGIANVLDCSAGALPLRRHSIVAACCVDALERLPDPSAGVAELARVLTAGGSCKVVSNNHHDIRQLARSRRDRPPRAERWPCDRYPSSRHLHGFGWAQLERLIEVRFVISRREAIGWEGGWRARLATAALRLPGARRLSSTIVLECAPR